MAELDFGENDKDFVPVAKGFMHRINGDYYGNGKPGFMETVLRFMTQFLAVEKERERSQAARHEANSEKLDAINTQLAEKNEKVARKSLLWTIVGVTVAMASLALTALAIVVSVWVALHAQMDPMQILRSHENGPVLSLEQPHESDLPPMKP